MRKAHLVSNHTLPVYDKADCRLDNNAAFSDSQTLSSALSTPQTGCGHPFGRKLKGKRSCLTSLTSFWAPDALHSGT